MRSLFLPLTLANARGPWTRGRLLHVAILVAIAAVPIVLYLPFLHEPLDRDEGVYATVALGWLDGHVPYRDLFDNKPPLHYAWYVLSFVTFGENLVAPRLLASIALGVTAVLVYVEGRLLFPRPAAYVAAAAFAIATGVAAVNENASTEAFMLPPLVGSLVAVTRAIQGGGTRWWLLAGVLGGLAILSKQVAVWNLVAIMAVAAYAAWSTPGPRRRVATPPALLMAGASAVVVAFLLTGSLDDLWDATVRFNLELSGAPAAQARGLLLLLLLLRSVAFAVVAGPLVVAASWGAVLAARRREWPRHHLVLAWPPAAGFGVASSGFTFLHYYMHLLPGLALLAGFVVESRLAAPRGRRAPPWGAVVGLAAAAALAAALSAPAYLAASPADRHLARSLSERASFARRDNASIEVGAYVAERTAPGDTIYVHGYESPIYFYAGRHPAVRYFYHGPLMVRHEGAAMAETIAALRLARPAFIVDGLWQTAEDSDWHLGDRLDAWEAFDPHPPQLMALLAEHYQYVGRLHFADLYRLKDGGEHAVLP